MAWIGGFGRAPSAPAAAGDEAAANDTGAYVPVELAEATARALLKESAVDESWVQDVWAAGQCLTMGAYIRFKSNELTLLAISAIKRHAAPSPESSSTRRSVLHEEHSPVSPESGTSPRGGLRRAAAVRRRAPRGEQRGRPPRWQGRARGHGRGRRRGQPPPRMVPRLRWTVRGGPHRPPAAGPGEGQQHHAERPATRQPAVQAAAGYRDFSLSLHGAASAPQAGPRRSPTRSALPA